MYLVYKTDANHSYESRDLIGCGTTPEIAIDICMKQAKKEGEQISPTEIYNLNTIKQTQGYSGEGEFHFEHVEVDALL